MRIVLTQPGRRRPGGASNVDDVRGLLDRSATQIGRGDLLLLPELIGGEADDARYEDEVRALAAQLGAWVVGGSHFRRHGAQWTNSGIVADPSGRLVVHYGKLNPYGEERARAPEPGRGPAAFDVGGVSCLVMICADFWHATAFDSAGTLPDLILVPAFSASQRPDPGMARARWRHAMVARAYEFAAFVAVSDWAHPVRYEAGTSSGVAGFAHPNPSGPDLLHQALGRRRVAAFELDMDAVRQLRANRESRGFDLTRHLRS